MAAQGTVINFARGSGWALELHFASSAAIVHQTTIVNSAFANAACRHGYHWLSVQYAHSVTGVVVLRRLELKNFKCFGDFTLDFRRQNILIGPNNAGKSTIISALRAGAAILNTATRRNPPETRAVGPYSLRVFPLQDFRLPLDLENIRYELHAEHATSMTLIFDNEVRATALWSPGDEPEGGCFFIEIGEGGQPASVKLARTAIDRESMGVLPHLRPIDPRETIRNPTYLQRQQGSRLASGHFRNQLALLDQEYLFGEYKIFVTRWLPEIELSGVNVDYFGDSVNAFYMEGGHERELSWAGDGIQVFLQILLHLFRAQGTSTVVLDEPEVFLHPELQQRLLGVLAEHGGQVVVATHSSEIVAAVPSDALAWIDKTQASSIRVAEGTEDAALVDSLGSIFNLKMARVLVTRRAFFVEGDDLKFLKRIAETLGVQRLDSRPDITVVPLNGGSNWRKLEAFDWIAQRFLKGALEGFAVFDRDFHTDETLEFLTDQLRNATVETHIWSCHEIENFLLVPSAVARLSGCNAGRVAEIIAEAAASMREAAIASTAGALAEEGRTRGLDYSTVFKNASKLVDAYWDDPAERIRRLPGKELLSALNRALQAEHFRTVSAVRLATILLPEEIDYEVARVIRRAVRAADA